MLWGMIRKFKILVTPLNNHYVRVMHFSSAFHSDCNGSIHWILGHAVQGSCVVAGLPWVDQSQVSQITTLYNGDDITQQ